MSKRLMDWMRYDILGGRVLVGDVVLVMLTAILVVATFIFFYVTLNDEAASQPNTVTIECTDNVQCLVSGEGVWLYDVDNGTGWWVPNEQ
jgi:hypothetical protein